MNEIPTFINPPEVNLWWLDPFKVLADLKLSSSCDVRLLRTCRRWFWTLTVSWAQSSCSGDHGQGGAAVNRAQVVLHVGVDVRVRGAEGRLARPRCDVWGQLVQGDVWDDRTSCQSWRSVETRRGLDKLEDKYECAALSESSSETSLLLPSLTANTE